MSEWPEWFTRFGIGQSDFKWVHVFDDGALMVDAARRGQGLALARSCLAYAVLRSGELVIPFPQFLPRRNAYYILASKSRIKTAAIDAFVRWITSETRAYMNDELAYLLQVMPTEA